jgi:MFS family permease
LGVLETVMRVAGRTADEIAGVVLGLLLASLSYLVVGWLWHEMRLPAFICFLVSWAFVSIGTMKLHRHKDLVRTSSAGWKSMKISDFGKHRVSLSESIWGDIATILWGVIAGFVVAGLLGKVWPQFRWPVFFVIFLLWTAVVVAGIAADRHDSGSVD